MFQTWNQFWLKKFQRNKKRLKLSENNMAIQKWEKLPLTWWEIIFSNTYVIAICSYLKNRGHAKVIVILMHFYWQRCVMLLKNVNDENREIAFEFFFALFCNVLDNKKNLSKKRLYTYDFHFCMLLIWKGIMNFEICKETLT